MYSEAKRSSLTNHDLFVCASPPAQFTKSLLEGVYALERPCAQSGLSPNPNSARDQEVGEVNQ